MFTLESKSLQMSHSEAITEGSGPIGGGESLQPGVGESLGAGGSLGGGESLRLGVDEPLGVGGSLGGGESLMTRSR